MQIDIQMLISVLAPIGTILGAWMNLSLKMARLSATLHHTQETLTEIYDSRVKPLELQVSKNNTRITRLEESVVMPPRAFIAAVTNADK